MPTYPMIAAAIRPLSQAIATLIGELNLHQAPATLVEQAEQIRSQVRTVLVAAREVGESIDDPKKRELGQTLVAELRMISRKLHELTDVIVQETSLSHVQEILETMDYVKETIQVMYPSEDFISDSV